MCGRLLSASLGLALLGCNGSSENLSTNQSAGGPLADAASERPIPCMVQRHGMAAVIGGKPAAACDDSVDPQTLPIDALIRIIPDQHPALYYVLATRLFDAGRRDEAVFWFYAGQLRYRIRLACHPNLPPDTEPALFGALHEEVGTRVNGYAGGDPPAWAAAMQRALDWDSATRNGFEPKAACRAQIDDQRRGMGALIAEVRATADRIRADRRANGLPNR